MSQKTPVPGDSSLAGDGAGSTIGGGTLFAAIMLLVGGLLGIIQGIAAIAEDDVYARIGNYVFEFDLTAWGWIHLIVGIIVALAGVGLFAGSNAARIAGVTVAGISVIVNFLWLPYQPWWSFILIAIGIGIIWTLCAHWHPAAD
ncbi:hypothetical protein MTF65_04180 [Streptomyces sp. APSN-46.1]|uniref:DUF7144 family membrane protein n=1 Tax=Streptomyces sp. APSN-46.1 TaxID=2929049 RepID=UPI001FB385EF|nr:hypothetical protein [Streptomyces sp. APSN-46.1]MCJ1676559.1 hypothetical protein [Streptomyces sp. APSN-46.1]